MLIRGDAHSGCPRCFRFFLIAGQNEFGFYFVFCFVLFALRSTRDSPNSRPDTDRNRSPGPTNMPGERAAQANIRCGAPLYGSSIQVNFVDRGENSTRFLSTIRGYNRTFPFNFRPV